jgi:predicted nucleotidyltransferase
MEEIRALCQLYQVRELALFGSALRDDFNPDSDLDFLVEFEPEAEVGFMSLARMQRELSAILNRKVDLVPKGGLKPKIRQFVLSRAKVVYAA